MGLLIAMCWISALEWVEAESRIELGHVLVMDWLSLLTIYSLGRVIALEWIGHYLALGWSIALRGSESMSCVGLGHWIVIY